MVVYGDNMANVSANTNPTMIAKNAIKRYDSTSFKK